MRRTAAGYLLGSLTLIALGGVSLAAGLLDRDIVRVQHDLATLRHDDDVDWSRIERRLEYASRLPWMDDASLNEIRAWRAASAYWQHTYDAVTAAPGNPVETVPAENVDLQLIVANALYRTREARATDRQTALQALDAETNAYLTVLKNSVRNVDAAYNFEYLLRLRDEIAKGRRKPSAASPSRNSPHGIPGGLPEGVFMNDFKMHVPMSEEEIDQKGRKEAGEARQPRKKG
jgi:hypothetical protein